ncbi:hypothetical protein [Micromonospora sp. NPDC051296]|uniref:hypothetical protein n=1 Tax=Micromonospora sp. NPDC051296 TaxID=3155046 RepID=UPI003430E8E9
MSDTRIVGKLISTAARSSLQPIGLARKGRSRLWYDDRGWSLIVAEFQPGRGPGTYLNVGAMWLWADRDYWAFDEGARLYWRGDGSLRTEPPLGEAGWTQHVDFLNADQFSRDVALAAEVAARRVVELRTQFPDVAAVADHLLSRATRRAESPLWHAFHAGAAAALGGDAAAAERSFAKVL